MVLDGYERNLIVFGFTLIERMKIKKQLIFHLVMAPNLDEIKKVGLPDKCNGSIELELKNKAGIRYGRDNWRGEEQTSKI